jgi:hypothetical protein
VFNELFGSIFSVLYRVITGLVALGAFLAAWYYAIDRYGFFLGVGLGWFPSLVIGAAAGLLWPLALVAYLGGWRW